MSKKLLSVILAIVVMASLCIVNASAAANNLETKTEALHTGDTVTYTVSLKYGDDVANRMAAIDASVHYDADVLKIESALTDVKFPVLGTSTIKNLNVAGEILFNNAAGTAGFAGFKDGGAVISVTFKVLKDAESTTISFATNEAFDLTLDTTTGNPIEGKQDAITSGFSAAVKVDCVNKTSDKDDSDKTSDKEDVTSDKTSDTTSEKTDKEESPKTGDVATVVMMLVFAAAVVAIVSKKRA